MYRSNITIKEEVKTGETNTLPSLTIVGEDYTIQELLEKHTRGIMPQIGRESFFSEDPTFDSPDLNKLSKMDITDKNEQKNAQTNIIKQIEDLKKAKKSERENLIKAQNEKLKNEKGSNKETPQTD